MTEAKHTPGPWVPDEHYEGDKYLYILADEDGGEKPICRLVVRDVQETAANARLIAAAPELLAALQEMHDRLIECSNCTSISARDAYNSHFQEVVTKALAKATQ